MNEFDDLTSRLKALGDNPVPPPVATQHLTAMAEVSAPRRFSQKLRVAAAFGVGIFVGGTGLGYAAANDALPEQAQSAVEAAGRVVGLEIAAEKKAAKADNGGENSSDPLDAPACGDEKNHGEYVSSNVKDARQGGIKGNARDLAKSDCGKDATDDDLTNADAGEEDGDKPAKNEDKGKPDDAGKPADVPAGGPEVENEGDDLDAEGDEGGAESEGGAEGAPGGGRPENPGNAPAETPAP